jgi:hypothetical protein
MSLNVVASFMIVGDYTDIEPACISTNSNFAFTTQVGPINGGWMKEWDERGLRRCKVSKRPVEVERGATSLINRK